MNGWAWLIWTVVCAAASLAAVAGVMLLGLAVTGRPRVAAGTDADEPRGRCDCCGYELAGLEHGLCPECGWRYAESRRRPRIRRVRAGAAGIGLLMLSGVAALSPQIAHRGVLWLLPDSALIAMLPLAPGGEPGATAGGGAGSGTDAGSAVHGALRARLDSGGLSDTQRAGLASRCAAIVMSGRGESVRAAAASLLAQVGANAGGCAGQVLSGLEDRSPRVRARVVDALAALCAGEGPGQHSARAQIVQRLMGAAVCDPDALVRRHAIEALGRVKGNVPGVSGVLAHAARDEAPMVRVRAMYAIGANPGDEGEDQRRLGALTAAVHDPHAGVREAAVFGLFRLAERRPGSGGIVPLIGLFLCDESSDVREMAASCLARLGQHAAPVAAALMERLDDPDPAVQDAAERALGAMGS